MHPPIDTAAAPLRSPTIRFTGSGSEYFRIWIVNLLLTLVTLGLYTPFAKARRIRYFYANTLVGDHALAFHGDPWKMFRGFALLVALMGAYGLAGRFSGTAALLAFLVLCAVWPALWRASMQFRLGNTSWRGLRLGFEGRLSDAYLAVAPLYVPLVAFLASPLLLAPSGDASADPAAAAAAGLRGLLVLVPLGAGLLLTPWFFTLTKRYQHRGFRIAHQRSDVDLPASSVYAIGVKGGLIGVIPVVLVFAAGIVAAVTPGSGGEPSKAMAAFWGIAGVLLFYLLWFVLVAPYFAVRMQNLVWSATRSQAITFESRLAFGDVFWLTLKNFTLVALTLSLYRPFAVVQMTRLRLQAVSIALSEDPSDWVAAAPIDMRDASGEIAGDFFGIDIGL